MYQTIFVAPIPMIHKPKIAIPIFLGILLLFCCVYYNVHITRLPYGIHEWAQADRYALALGYYENGMNFFKPSTLSLYSDGGISGVEFPIQSYIAAALAFIFGKENISVLFRLENTVIACTGLFFLFLTMLRQTRNFFVSLVPPLFIFCSPVFIFYACNYLSDCAAASLAFVSFYYLFRFWDDSRARNIFWVLFWLTIATLLKTSAAVYLLSILGWILWLFIFKRNQFSRRQWGFLFCAMVASIALPIAQFLYIRYLNEIYHSSLFLTRALPFENWDDFYTYINVSFKYQWYDQYFVLPQYLVFVVIVVAAIPLLNRLKSFLQLRIILWLFLLGSLSMAALLGHNLHVHDYYIIAIFFPLVAFTLMVSIMALTTLATTKDAKKALQLAALSSVIITFLIAVHANYLRTEKTYRENPDNYSSSWMRNGAEMLNRLAIPQNARILVLHEYPCNIGQVYFDRKGYNIPPPEWDEGSDLSKIVAFMKERQVQILVVREASARSYLQQDSLKFQAFQELKMEDGKAIFRLKE
ncbi:MAG: hypothetical protein ABI378_10605 [Chitinophagaceae bacterium]